MEGQVAGINMPLVAVAAAHRDLLTIDDALAAVAAADDGGDAHLAGNDGGVAGAAALVGNDATGALENRLPIGIGAAGHQHVAGGETLNLTRIANQPGPAAADRGPNRPTRHQGRRRRRIEMPAAQYGGGLARRDRFGPGLEDEQLTAGAILGPFDIHRCGLPPQVAVVRFDAAGPAGQLQGLGIAEGKAPLLVQGYGFVDQGIGAKIGAAKGGAAKGGGALINQSLLFAAQAPAQDRIKTQGQGGLENQ